MDNTTAPVGPLLRRLRQQRGLRLEDLAHRAGFTKGFMSKLENGHATPPIATLMRLAQALGVEPGVFFGGENGNGAPPDATVHVPKRGRKKIENRGAGPGYEYWALAAPRTHKAMEPFLLTVHPDEYDPKRRFEHPGEEFIYVLSGRVRYRVGPEIFLLENGDSLYFDSHKPHAPEPLGGPVTFLALFYAPPRPAHKAAATRAGHKTSTKRKA